MRPKASATRFPFTEPANSDRWTSASADVAGPSEEAVDIQHRNHPEIGRREDRTSETLTRGQWQEAQLVQGKIGSLCDALKRPPVCG